jgi:MFS family permease
MNLIKWWKDKIILAIYGVIVLAMVLSFLTAYYLSNPFNWLLPILICIPCGLVIRKLIVKKLTETFEELETNN